MPPKKLTAGINPHSEPFLPAGAMLENRAGKVCFKIVKQVKKTGLTKIQQPKQ